MEAGTARTTGIRRARVSVVTHDERMRAAPAGGAGVDRARVAVVTARWSEAGGTGQQDLVDTPAYLRVTTVIRARVVVVADRGRVPAPVPRVTPVLRAAVSVVARFGLGGTDPRRQAGVPGAWVTVAARDDVEATRVAVAEVGGAREAIIAVVQFPCAPQARVTPVRRAAVPVVAGLGRVETTGLRITRVVRAGVAVVAVHDDERAGQGPEIARGAHARVAAVARPDAGNALPLRLVVALSKRPADVRRAGVRIIAVRVNRAPHTGGSQRVYASTIGALIQRARVPITARSREMDAAIRRQVAGVDCARVSIGAVRRRS